MSSTNFMSFPGIKRLVSRPIMIEQNKKNKTVNQTNPAVARVDFKTVKVVHESKLLMDKKNSVCLLKWQGRVDLETASELLILGGAAVTLNGLTKIVVDRRSLIEFDNEARIWIDNWLRKKAKSISVGVEKVAIINSEWTFGNFFNNVFNSTIAQVIPHLTIRKFDTGRKAMSWLLKLSEK